MAESLPRNLDNLSLKDLKKSKKEGGSLPLSSAAVMIYWNPSQLSLLRERKETKKRVLFNSDFGCGKTMLEKNFAEILAEKETQNGHKQKVFFLQQTNKLGNRAETPSAERICSSMAQLFSFISILYLLQYTLWLSPGSPSK